VASCESRRRALSWCRRDSGGLTLQTRTLVVVCVAENHGHTGFHWGQIMDASDAAAVPKLKTAAAARAAAPARQYITWMAMCLMTVSAVASIRNTPSMAMYGLTAVFLYVLPAIVFLLPTSLVAAELASGWEGGVYNWCRQGISAPMGFLAVWTQFAMTIFYYPSLLAYVASTFAYVIDPALASNGFYTAAVIIVVFWLATMISLRGVGAIAGLASGGLIIGTLVPAAGLLVLGIVYLLQGNSSAAPMDASHLLPEWTGVASLVLIVGNFLSYAGMEVNAVHVSSLRDPAKEFPRAMFLAIGLVVVIFTLPTLAISWVVPSSELSLTAGVMQAFAAFFAYFDVTWLTPVIAIMLIAASLGGMMCWLAGPSRGLLLVGKQEGYLPPFLQRVNKNNVQVVILLAQGVVTTVIALLFAFLPSVQSVYWIFSVWTTQIYLIMYVLMFVAALRLRKIAPDHPRGYRAPFLPVLVGVGIAATIAAFVIGFVPPSQFGGGDPVAYAVLILVGVALIGFAIPLAFYWARKPSWKTAAANGGAAAVGGAGEATGGGDPAAGAPPTDGGAER